MKSDLKQRLLLLLLLMGFLFCGSTSVFAQQDYSNTRVKNTSGQPLGLMGIQDHGKKVATLYITGAEATFGPNQGLMKGSGYVQALPNESVSLIAFFRYRDSGETNINFEEFGIRVNRIEWNDDGKTTSISGMSPVAQTDLHESLKIISDPTSPILTNGVLVLDVEKLGKIYVDFRFGGFGGKLTGLGYRGTLVGDPILEFPNEGDARLTAAIAAMKSGDLEKVKSLLEENPDLIFSKDKYGGTLLIDAIEYGQAAAWVTPMSELLLSKKADVKAKGPSNMTALHWAAAVGLKDAVVLLLANGADIDAKDNYGRTPLKLADTNGRAEAADLLRQHGGHE
jgi:hypothetical protein